MEIVCKQEAETNVEEKTRSEESPSAVIVCRNCLNKVTDPDSRIRVDGAFSHTFANPHGHVFEIGCFSDAAGCIPASPPSSEFAWFPGYEWEIGICTQCAAHLGWIFTTNAHRFYGLILDKLIIP